MFCRKCEHKADGLGSAHELQKRFDGGRSRMRFFQNSIGRFSPRAGLSITLEKLQHNTKHKVMDVFSKSALNWKAYESVSFICAEGLKHFGALSTEH